LYLYDEGIASFYPPLRTQFSIAEELFIQGGDSLFLSPSKEATPLDLEKAIFHCRRVIYTRRGQPLFISLQFSIAEGYY
jgi:hypothetical protein